MKRVVFLVSGEMIKIAEMAMLKLGFATRAEFFKHTAFLFLYQAGFINAKTLGLHEIAQTLWFYAGLLATSAFLICRRSLRRTRRGSVILS